MATSKKPRTKKNIHKPQDAGVFIDLRTDFGFKRLFGEKDLMIDFLNSVLDISIVDLEYRNTVRTVYVCAKKHAEFERVARYT